jgi:hypothetical protein
MRKWILALAAIVPLLIASSVYANGPQHGQHSRRGYRPQHRVSQQQPRSHRLQYQQYYRPVIRPEWIKHQRTIHRCSCSCNHGRQVSIRIYNHGQNFRVREHYRGQVRIYHGRR